MAESLARHGIINLVDEGDDEIGKVGALNKFKSPNKQQLNLIQNGFLHRNPSQNPGAFSVTPIPTLSPDPLKVLKHFVKPEHLQDASSMLATAN